MSKINKNGISPVVATALLIVVAVISAISFQNWFQFFSSSTFSDIEQKSTINTGNILTIESLNNNILYLKSGNNQILKSFKIIDKLGTEMCNLDSFNSTKILLNFDNETYNGTHSIDLSKFENNGENLFGVSHTKNCLSNECFTFDKDNDRIRINSDESIDNLTEFSYSIWVNINGSPEASAGCIFSKHNFECGESKANGRISIIYRTAFHNEYFYSQIGHTINVSQIYSSNYYPTPKNKWFHLVMTYSDNTKDFNLYVNGIKNIDSEFPSAGIKIDDTGQNIYIGNSIYGSRTFNGLIDEFSLYSKILTEKEVSNLYQTQKAVFYEQIIPIGIKEMDISICNIEKGEIYDIIGTTNTNIIEKTVIAK